MFEVDDDAESDEDEDDDLLVTQAEITPSKTYFLVALYFDVFY